MKHKHHIVPKHAGGTDDPSNLIELSVEEHAEAHRLLFEQYGRWQDWCAWKGLLGVVPKVELMKIMYQQNAVTTKEYWNSDKGEEKRQRLIERNKTKHKKIMEERWKNPTEAMKNRVCHGRTKGAKDIVKRKERYERKIYAEGFIFNNAKEASEHFDIHPVNIRRRCRLLYNGKWRYLDESCDNN